MSECYVPTCNRKIRAGHLMCGHHWGDVSLPTQRRVHTELRIWNSGGPMIGYLQAREKAVHEASERGRCIYCGCRDVAACLLPGLTCCSWVNTEHTVCSNPDCITSSRLTEAA